MPSAVRLAAQPAMQQVLADLAVESWAATATAMRLATLVERSIGGDQQATALLRIALPVAKFWVCKRATPMIAEALECLGGNGYVETYPMARLLRESPLNGIWEGSGTVTALDSLRALHRSPESRSALLDELGTATGASADYDHAVRQLAELLDAAAGTCRGPPDRLAGRTDAGRLVVDQTGTRPGCRPLLRNPAGRPRGPRLRRAAGRRRQRRCAGHRSPRSPRTNCREASAALHCGRPCSLAARLSDKEVIEAADQHLGGGLNEPYVLISRSIGQDTITDVIKQIGR